MKVTKQKTFSVDETTSHWSNEPSRTCIAREEKSTSGFKAPKDRRPLSGAYAAGDFTRLKAILILRSENQRACKCRFILNEITMSGRQHIYLQHGLLNSLNPLLRPTAKEKKMILFKQILLNDNSSGHSSALMEV